MEGSHGLGRGAPAQPDNNDEKVNNYLKSSRWAQISCFVLMLLCTGAAFAGYFTLGPGIAVGFWSLSAVFFLGFVFSCVCGVKLEQEQIEVKKLEEKVEGLKENADQLGGMVAKQKEQNNAALAVLAGYHQSEITAT